MPWAGPNAGRGRLWAIMKLRRTVRLNTELPRAFCCGGFGGGVVDDGVFDDMAERVQRAVGEPLDDVGQLVEGGGAGEEHVEPGIAEQRDGEPEPVGVGAAVAAGAGHDAHLAGADGEPSGVEVLPQRHGDPAVGVPGHFDDVAGLLYTHQAELAAEAGAVAVSAPMGGEPEIAEVALTRYVVSAMELVDVDEPIADPYDEPGPLRHLSVVSA